MSKMHELNSYDHSVGSDRDQFVTVVVGGQLFGLPIQHIRDVFVVSDMTRVPLASNCVAGLYNLRGHVLTMLSLRAFLNIEALAVSDSQIAIGIEWQGESLGLLVDSVGEVMTLSRTLREANPANLDPRWASFSAGVFRLEDRLLVQLSLNHLLSATLKKAA
jgi:purine-binding chemotaxis protein CheW